MTDVGLNILIALTFLLARNAAEAQQIPTTTSSQPAVIRNAAGQPVSMPHFPAGTDHVTLRLEQVGRMLLTRDVRINAQDVGLFLIDTGSNVTSLDADIADRLGLPAIDGAPSVARQFRKVQTIDLGAVSITNHFVHIADLTQLGGSMNVTLAGILGGDVLSHFPFAIDYRDLSLTLYAEPQFHPDADAIAYPITLAKHEGFGQLLGPMGPYGLANPDAGAPTIHGTVNGVDCRLLMGSGQINPITVYPAMSRQHPEWLDLLGGPGRVVLGEGEKTYAANIDGVSVFGHRFEHPILCDGAESLGPAQPLTSPENPEIDAIVGQLVLNHFRLTFDYPRRQLWVQWRPPLSAAQRLSAGWNPNSQDLAGVTPLMDAARFGDLADVKTLLAAGADATASESHGITVLHYATEGGNAKVVAALLKLPAVKAQINATQVGGGTPLMGAAKSRSAAIVAQLLNAGADVHARTRMGDTALHYAAAIGDLDEIAALLGHGADINAAANDTSTPLDRVIQSSGSPQAYDAIVKAGGHVGALTQEMGALNFAASSGHEELVRHLLQVLRPAPDVNGCDEQGSPCIVLAAASGNTWCVAALLDAGADANDSRRKDHITALHLAAQQNNVEMIRLLLVHNAAVDARTVPGKVAPIHMAAGRGQLDAIAALLDAGADKEAADENGWTALHWAAHSGQDRAVAFLLKSGFNPDAKRKGGESAADVAQAAGYSEIAATIRASILHAPTQGQ